MEILKQSWLRTRNRVRWEGRSYREKPCGEFFSLHPRKNELLKKYPQLLTWCAGVDRSTIEFSLAYLDLLDHLDDSVFESFENALDVGVHSWKYLPGLLARLKLRKHAVLNGLEIDAFRLFTDLSTSASRARYFTECARHFGLQGVQARFHAGDFLKWNSTHDLVFCFFPFLHEDVSERWGLPSSSFGPRDFFTHLGDVLPSGGRLVLVNQGQHEWQKVSQLSELKLQEMKTLPHTLHPSDQTIFLSSWIK